MNKPYITHEELFERLQSIVKQNGTQKRTAKLLHISEQYLSDILDGSRDISERVANELGYTMHKMFSLLEEE